MATARPRGRQVSANLTVSRLGKLWAAVLSALLAAAALALSFVGAICVFVGIGAVIGPEGVANTILGVLFAVGGSLAACGGVLTAVWVALRAFGKPAGRTPAGRAINRVAGMVLSLVYLASWVSLLGFGGACAWNGLGPGDSATFDHPVAGVVMLASGVVALIFFPGRIRELTGHNVLSGSGGFYGGFGGDGGGGGGGDGGGGGC